jgi:hypothetical protein
LNVFCVLKSLFKFSCINENHLLCGWFKKAFSREQKIKDSFVRTVFRFADQIQNKGECPNGQE